MRWTVTPWIAARVRVASLRAHGVHAVMSIVQVGLGTFALGVRVGDVFEEVTAELAVRRWRMVGRRWSRAIDR